MANPNEVVSPPRALHAFYARVSDGSVYPAFSNPPAYQDNTPEDWRPATAGEVAEYKAGEAVLRDRLEFHPDGSTVTTGNGIPASSGGVIQLTPEAEAVPEAVLEAIPAAIVIPPASE